MLGVMCVHVTIQMRLATNLLRQLKGLFHGACAATEGVRFHRGYLYIDLPVYQTAYEEPMPSKY